MIDYRFVDDYNSSNDYRNLSTVYHKGHRNGWDGKQVLDDLIEKHGIPSLEPEVKIALAKVLSLILWGEFAAWQTSGSLAFELDDFDAKMAATSQVHDEARHFYVMCDYMERVLGVHPRDAGISKTAEVGFSKIIQAGSLPKKLLGVQLMVEPVAIVIFLRVLKKIGFQSYNGSGSSWIAPLSDGSLVRIDILRESIKTSWMLSTPRSVCYFGQTYYDIEPHLPANITEEMVYFLDLL